MSPFLERAHELRACQTRHYNCAQSVVVPFAGAAGFTEEQAMRFAANFGSGMKMASVCGAVTGGLMVLGMFGAEDPQTIQEYYRKVRENHENMLECRDLLRRNIERGGEKKPHCDAMVYECIGYVQEILAGKGLLNM